MGGAAFRGRSTSPRRAFSRCRDSLSGSTNVTPFLRSASSFLSTSMRWTICRLLGSCTSRAEWSGLQIVYSLYAQDDLSLAWQLHITHRAVRPEAYLQSPFAARSVACWAAAHDLQSCQQCCGDLSSLGRCNLGLATSKRSKRPDPCRHVMMKRAPHGERGDGWPELGETTHDSVIRRTMRVQGSDLLCA